MGGAGLSRECPDGEGVASTGEELTLSELLTPRTVGPTGEAGMPAPEVYCPFSLALAAYVCLSSVFEESVGVRLCACR